MFTNFLKSSILLFVAVTKKDNKKTFQMLLTINVESCYYFEVAS